MPAAGIPDGVLCDAMLPELVKMHSLHGEALKRYLMKEVEFMVTPRLMRLPEEFHSIGNEHDMPGDALGQTCELLQLACISWCEPWH